MQNIVVGVDGSASSDAALRFAAEDAATHGCRLVAVHAWSMPVMVGSPYAPSPALAADLEGAAKEVLAGALDRVLGAEAERGMPVEGIVAQGHAGEVLLRHAVGARELVVGSRGRGGFVGLLLGSVSQHCAHHAPCPIVIVPAPCADETTRARGELSQ